MHQAALGALPLPDMHCAWEQALSHVAPPASMQRKLGGGGSISYQLSRLKVMLVSSYLQKVLA